MRKVVVIDNGGDTCKAGLSTSEKPKLFPNCATKPKKDRRLYIADQLDEVPDKTSLTFRRPHDKGYVVDWDLQEQVWTRVFGKSNLDVKTPECSLVVTEPLFTPAKLSQQLSQLTFEKFEFSSLSRVPSAPMSSRGHALDVERFGLPCSLVIDTGFSFTHVTPVFDGSPLNHAARRINVGGKLLTNYLKELVSYRSFNLMDETYLINQLKHQLCYISTDFEGELAKAKKNKSLLLKQYLLPNGSDRLDGVVLEEKSEYKIQPEDQVLTVSNERIVVPEVLFHPSDLGMSQAGLAEAVVASITACPLVMQAPLYSNIVLVGGNALLPNLATRLEQELRELAPSVFPIRIQTAQDPLTATWRGAAHFARDGDFTRYTVSRADYLEHGHSIVERKFTFNS